MLRRRTLANFSEKGFETLRVIPIATHSNAPAAIVRIADVIWIITPSSHHLPTVILLLEQCGEPLVFTSARRLRFLAYEIELW
jgi:hypothetical protein